MADTNKQKLDLSGFLYSINKSKTNLIRTSDNPKKAAKLYPAFIVNRLLSYHVNAILFLNLINTVGSDIPPEMQYGFNLHVLERSYRFDRLHKPEVDADIQAISDHYQCSKAKARELLDLIDAAELEYLRELSSNSAQGGFV